MTDRRSKSSQGRRKGNARVKRLALIHHETLIDRIRPTDNLWLVIEIIFVSL